MPTGTLRRTEPSRTTVPVTGVEDRPWNWSWFRWRKGEGAVLGWILLLHAMAITGLVLFPVPSLGVGLAALTLGFLGGLGTTVGYHRVLAHRAVHLHPWVEQLFIFFAVFNGSGAPCSWAANHRLHHAYSDKEGDISSPTLGGFWWSHLRWLWQAPAASWDRWVPDMKDLPKYHRWTPAQPLVLAISLFAAAPFGLEAMFWVGAIRLAFCLHVQCSVNSIAHMKKERKRGQDQSLNIAWITPFHFGQGENWHENHHARPGSARIGWKWWQLDLGWWTIVGLKWVGLASKIRVPRFLR